MAKRKLKQTKKAIQSRIYYQRAKLKKLEKEILKYSDRSEKKKVQFGIGKGKKSHKTIHNILLNNALDINKIISKEQKKLKTKSKLPDFTETFKKERSKRKKGGRVLKIGNLWNRKELEDHLNEAEIKTVNGLKKSTHFPEIHNQIDLMFIRAFDKYAQIILTVDPEGNAKVHLTGERPDQKHND